MEDEINVIDEGSETIGMDYKEEFEQLIESQSELYELLSEGSEIQESDSYIELLNMIIDNQNTLIDSLDIITLSSSSIITYAIVFVPLVAVIGALWWFFKQFIR